MPSLPDLPLDRGHTSLDTKLGEQKRWRSPGKREREEIVPGKVNGAGLNQLLVSQPAPLAASAGGEQGR